MTSPNTTSEPQKEYPLMSTEHETNHNRWSRHLHWRQSAPDEALGVDEVNAPLFQLAYEAIGEDLRQSIASILKQHLHDQVTRDELQTQIDSSIDNVLQKHLPALPVSESRIGTPTEIDPVDQAPSSVDEALSTFRQSTQQLFATAKPGVIAGAAAVWKLLPELLNRAVPLLAEIVQDEKKLAAFRKSATEILARYMPPKSAERVIEAAIYLARQAIRHQGEK
jgi:hypothetical protein